eukprot:11338707-Alexandrium_andersonii.AAC.1
MVSPRCREQPTLTARGSDDRGRQCTRPRSTPPSCAGSRPRALVRGESFQRMWRAAWKPGAPSA